MAKRDWMILTALAASLLLAGVTLAAPGAPTVDWWVLGGGDAGGTAGNVALHATAGQPVVGLDEDGGYAVCAGFWCGSSLAAGSPASTIYLPLVLSD